MRYHNTTAGLSFEPTVKVGSPLVGEVEASALKAVVGRSSGVHSVGACRDPKLELSVLLPWEEVELNLVDHLAADFSDLTGQAVESEAVRNLADGYLPRERPRGLEVWVDPNALDLDAGETVGVIVQIQAGEACQMAFALRAAADDGGYVIGPVVAVDIR